MGKTFLELDKPLLLVLSQRDIHHPLSGGAEVFVHKSFRKLAKSFTVVHISSRAKNQPPEEVLDGIHYIRRGNLLTVIIEGYKFYLQNRKNVLLVFDHCNTHQFFSFIWARHKRVFLIHQLTQEIFLYFMGPLAGRLCWLFENILLWFNRIGTTITPSQSTKDDLIRKGFNEIFTCPQGNVIKKAVLPEIKKEEYLVYVGRLVPYKRVEDAIQLAAEVNREIKIIGTGSEKYTARLTKFARSTGARVEFMGYLPTNQKDAVIQSAYLNIMPSIREGWGLVITECANLGTPSLVYPRPGVIEATNYGKAGFIADGVGVRYMSEAFNRITPDYYQHIRSKAFEYSLEFDWDNVSNVFFNIIQELIYNKYKPV